MKNLKIPRCLDILGLFVSLNMINMIIEHFCGSIVIWILDNKGTKRFIESKIVKSRLTITKTEFATQYTTTINISALNFK